MMNTRIFTLVSGLCIASASLLMVGCEKKADAPAKPSTDTTATKDDHGHDHAAGSNHDHSDSKDAKATNDDGHGPTTELGEQIIDGYTIKASRDGDIIAGSDAPIDVWISGGTDKVAAVRFWIGTQDGKGSVKARAEIERDNWHTHAEVPSPLPDGSKLWVEIESDKGAKTLASFDLKTS